MTTDANRVIIMGARIAANMTAAYIKLKHPHLEVVVVGRADKQPPLVGESLTEYSTTFLQEIGMGEAMEQRQFPKHGLAFYFKEHIDDPASRRYAVHEAPDFHPIPSYLINRYTFDEELVRINEARGIQFEDAQVINVKLDPSGLHAVEMQDANGDRRTLTANFIVDATGRRRFLARKLGLHREPMHQRSTFWIRLADFDPALLNQLNAIRTNSTPYDPYYMAHHFLGRGNWIWCIPMRSDDHKSFMSIGIVFRSDMLPKMTTLEEFLRQIDKEHPVVADLIRSGRVVDVNSYGKYMYETAQLYSADRWFMVGDSTDTADPLYSTGLVSVAIQATQITKLIGASLEGRLDATLASDFERAYKTIRDTTQREIGTLYDVMHDPFQAHWRIHITTAVYFHFMLPQVLSGYMVDQVGSRWIRKTGVKNRHKIRLLNDLIQRASARLGPLRSEDIRNRFDETVNWSLCTAKEEDVPRYLAHLLVWMVRVRVRLLRSAGWSGWYRHLPVCAVDLWLAAFLYFCMAGRSLKRSFMIRFYTGMIGLQRR